MRLVLATYNIHGCVGGDKRYDRDRTLGVLQELQADVLALQEIDSEDTLQWLAVHTKLTPISGPTLRKGTGHFGNGLLTSCIIGEIRLVDLSFPPYEPRGAIDTDLHCGRETVQVIATHLGLWPSERRTQVQELLKRFGTKHCILMGDINEWFLWGRPLRWITAIFGRTRALRSFPSRCPIFALDRIWIRPPGTLVEMRVHRSRAARQASDHLPVRAVIEW